MNKITFNPLQIREIFHIEFLRWFGRRAKTGCYVLKGGVNLRLFYRSQRYSEDMDLDISNISVNVVREIILDIISSTAFISGLKPFGIEGIKVPDMSKAKQTQTMQRFKIHLFTSAGEDLFTKIECSRRGFAGNAIVESASEQILRAYKVPPLLVPHYDLSSAVKQKITALASRTAIQARDIFDLYLLTSQGEPSRFGSTGLQEGVLRRAYENVFEISFLQFRDTVFAYLSAEDQDLYVSEASWQEIQLKTARFIEELQKENA
jgi:predicted nucleotidyltransferase component of viral defense system